VELGHACRLVNARSWVQNLGRLAPPFLARRIESFEPDTLILSRHAMVLGEERLRRLTRGRYSAFWYFDLRIPPIGDVITLGKLVDAMYTTYLPQVEIYRALGIANVMHLPQGMDPDLDRPADRVSSKYRCEVAFIGNGNFAHRLPVLRAVAGAAQLHIRGTGWRNAEKDLPVVGGPVYGRAYAEAVAGAAISLGANSMPEMEAQYASASNRMWKVMGCGGFYLGEWVSGIDWFARDGEHCAWYRGPDEAVAQVRRYLADPEARRRIAEAGRRHALAHHTYASRVKLLLQGRGYELDQRSHTSS
jgi:spore maturation protein CgeB